MIDRDEDGMPTEAFYAEADPCESCGEPTYRGRVWNAEYDLWIAVDCSCNAPGMRAGHVGRLAKSENTRAEAEKAPSDLTGQLERSIEAIQERKRVTEPPTPICRPVKSRPAPEIQPRLFDRGTGTHGPAPAAALMSIPLPAMAIGRQSRPGQIPANVATREILAFVNADPSTANWSADAKQDLASTILIASFKAGYIGLWERS